MCESLCRGTMLCFCLCLCSGGCRRHSWLVCLRWKQSEEVERDHHELWEGEENRNTLNLNYNCLTSIYVLSVLFIGWFCLYLLSHGRRGTSSAVWSTWMREPSLSACEQSNPAGPPEITTSWYRSVKSQVLSSRPLRWGENVSEDVCLLNGGGAIISDAFRESGNLKADCLKWLSMEQISASE